MIMEIDSGDTGFILFAIAAVLIMTPGLALFYGGLLRKKSILNMMALCLASMFISAITWLIVGYSLGFGPDIGGLFGDPGEYAGLIGVWEEGKEVGTIPLVVFIGFQLVFLMITTAILASPFAERSKFSGFLIFMLVWTVVVYSPVAHWVWGGGWIGADGIGALDFAGGTVVHINSGMSAVAVALVIGKRKDFKKYEHKPISIPYVVTGLGLLWFGWLAFNGGSALGANGIAGLAMLNTMISACAAAMIWIIIESMDKNAGKPSLIGMCTAVLAGLIGVTPAAGTVEPIFAAIIGMITSTCVYYALKWKNKTGLDETLDAFACHGVGGIVGSILTGVFSTVGATSLITGDVAQFGVQIVATLATVLYSFGASYIIALLVKKFIGLRITEDEEYIGVDIAEHGEVA
jgi:Amt family ammonium transporter